jgi:hypothetical protein
VISYLLQHNGDAIIIFQYVFGTITHMRCCHNVPIFSASWQIATENQITGIITVQTVTVRTLSLHLVLQCEFLSTLIYVSGLIYIYNAKRLIALIWIRAARVHISIWCINQFIRGLTNPRFYVRYTRTLSISIRMQYISIWNDWWEAE